jgi:hypothetical protein
MNVALRSSRARRKYEEIHPPAVDEFVYISDNTYTRDEVRHASRRMSAGRPRERSRSFCTDAHTPRAPSPRARGSQILRMEAGILNRLDFVLTVATPKVFLKRFFRAATASCKAQDRTKKLSNVRALGRARPASARARVRGSVCLTLRARPSATSARDRAQYLCELTLQEYTFLKYLPSMIAASCLFLSLHAIEKEEDWQWVRALAPSSTAPTDCTETTSESGCAIPSRARSPSFARLPRRRPRAQDETMVHYTRYTLQDLDRCTEDLLTMWSKASTNSLQAVQEKYGTSKFGEVSNIRPPTSLPPMD